MAKLDVSASATIPATPERLWQLICDTTRYAEWVEGTEAVARTDGPAIPNSTYVEVNPILGPWKATATWTVVESQPPHRQVHSSPDIPLSNEFLVIMEITPEGNASRLTHTLRATSSYGPIGAAFFALLRRRTRRNNELSVQRLSEIAKREIST
jgi:carbon monoxide dehydrogenase subunit G